MDGPIGDILSSVILDTSIDLDITMKPKANIFEERKRAHWANDNEARCDFSDSIRLVHRSDLWFVSRWKKTVYGRRLTEIKADDAMIPFFVENITPLISGILGENLSHGNWCIVTTPKRRHKERNFASLIAEMIAVELHIPFYEDCAFAANAHRMNATFTLNREPRESNVIVYDDFITTGQTMAAMNRLLLPLNKNLIFFTNINNKL